MNTNKFYSSCAEIVPVRKLTTGYLSLDVGYFVNWNNVKKTLVDNEKHLKFRWKIGGKAGKRTGIVPKEITVNERVGWFLGLRKGDKSEFSHEMVGIGNGNLSVIKEILEVLLNDINVPSNTLKLTIKIPPSLHAKSEQIKNSTGKALHDFPQPQIKIRTHMGRAPFYTLYTINTVLRRALDWLDQNIDTIFSSSPPTVECAWHAGNFDAEGHVDKALNSFWWATSDGLYAEWQKKRLGGLGLNAEVMEVNGNYGGYPYKHFRIKVAHNERFRKHDFEVFKSVLLPFLKHCKKHRGAIELINGNRLREVDLEKYLPHICHYFGNRWFTNAEFSISVKRDPEGTRKILHALVSGNYLEKMGQGVNQYAPFLFRAKNCSLLLFTHSPV